MNIFDILLVVVIGILFLWNDIVEGICDIIRACKSGPKPKDKNETP